MRTLTALFLLIFLAACNPDTPSSNTACTPAPGKPAGVFTSIVIGPGEHVNLEVGQKFSFGSSGRDFSGKSVELNNSPVWSSSNPSVVSIDPCSHEVTAVAAGRSEIKASLDGIVGTAIVTVGVAGLKELTFTGDADFNGLKSKLRLANTVITNDVVANVSEGLTFKDTTFVSVNGVPVYRFVAFSISTQSFTAGDGLEALQVGKSYVATGLAYEERSAYAAPGFPRRWRDISTAKVTVEARNGKTFTLRLEGTLNANASSFPESKGKLVLNDTITVTAP